MPTEKQIDEYMLRNVRATRDEARTALILNTFTVTRVAFRRGNGPYVDADIDPVTGHVTFPEYNYLEEN